jgi:hypothetical protein
MMVFAFIQLLESAATLALIVDEGERMNRFVDAAPTRRSCPVLSDDR